MQYRLPLSLLLTLAACGDPSVERADGSPGFLRDGGTAEPPSTPRLETVLTPVPWPVATLRGMAAMADRVIVEGAGNPIAKMVLPDSTFCVDVPLPTPGTYEIELVSQRDGAFSAESATTVVVFDPAAAPTPGATTCNGTSPAGCAGATEVCDNGVDDDCNGLRDLRDPACVTCADDVLEPNDDTSAPRIEPGRYEGLEVCAGNGDYYGIYLRRGDALTVRLFFSHADGDIDLRLLATDGETVLERALSTTDDETITFTATAEGQHFIHVYGVAEAANSYVLDVGVE